MAEGVARYGPATEAFAAIAIPVAIVAAAGPGQRSCATSTVTYVSLAPPQVAIAMHPGSRTSRLVSSSREFSVSLLAAEQVDIAIAAGQGARTEDKFAEHGIATVEPPQDAGFRVPGIAGAISVLWCRVVAELTTGDHVVFVGGVVARLDVDDTGGVELVRRRPLIRFDRRYLGLDPTSAARATDGYPV
jgi:flavin reductase (DIM6/NTAB) family NADH-FMN oxidoreductase RutF